MHGLLDISSLLYTKAFRFQHNEHPTHSVVKDVLIYLSRPPYKVKRMVICFDGPHAKKRRRDLYPLYKEQRKQGDLRDIVKGAVQLLQAILPYTPYPYACVDGLEADDVIASLCKSMKGKIVILSGDKDLYQLVNDQIIQVDINGKEIILPNNSEQHLLEKILVGDKSDNIRGLEGIGPKKAQALMQQGGLETILRWSEAAGGIGSTPHTVVESVLLRNQALMCLRTTPLLTEEDHINVKACVLNTWHNTWDIDTLVNEFHFDEHELRTMIAISNRLG